MDQRRWALVAARTERGGETTRSVKGCTQAATKEQARLAGHQMDSKTSIQCQLASPVYKGHGVTHAGACGRGVAQRSDGRSSATTSPIQLVRPGITGQQSPGRDNRGGDRPEGLIGWMTGWEQVAGVGQPTLKLSLVPDEPAAELTWNRHHPCSLCLSIAAHLHPAARR